MSRSRDLESPMDELGGWVARGRSAAARFDGDAYRRRVARAAEALADETSYRYRRAKRHVRRHPVATVAIVAGAVGALLLLRQALRRNDGD